MHLFLFMYTLIDEIKICEALIKKNLVYNKL